MTAVGGSGGSAVYGLKYGARCLSAVLGTTDAHRFLVGTNSCRDRGALNELHAIEFDDDDNAIRCKAVYAHTAGEVWGLAPAPTKPELVVTAYRPATTAAGASATAAPAAAAAATPAAAGTAAAPQVPNAVATPSSSSDAAAAAAGDYRVSLWRMKDDAKGSGETAGGLSALDELVELKGHSGTVRAVVWATADDSRLVTCDAGAVRLWTVDTGASTPTATAVTSAAGSQVLNAIGGAAWDPHRPQQLSVLNDKAIVSIDLRTMKESLGLANAHSDVIRDIDYNPNKPSYVVTCGDDRHIKFWDVRKFGAPLRVLTGHTHWVTSAKYNRAHDQLVLSAGSDAAVKLWSIVSISSAPLGDLEDPANAREGDKLVKTYDEHDDSVYAVSWSAKDAWVFASVSHGGQVVCNHVPQPEKYKILL